VVETHSRLEEVGLVWVFINAGFLGMDRLNEQTDNIECTRPHVLQNKFFWDAVVHVEVGGSGGGQFEVILVFNYLFDAVCAMIRLHHIQFLTDFFAGDFQVVCVSQSYILHESSH